MVVHHELDDHGIVRVRGSVSNNGNELGGLQSALPELERLASLGLQRVCERVSTSVPRNQLEREFRRLMLPDAEREPSSLRLGRRDGVRDGARMVPRLEPH